MQPNDDTTATTDAINEDVVEKKRISKNDIVHSLADAVQSGMITAWQARELKAQLGVSQAYFTRKQRTKAQRKTRRKIQRASRKMNRGRVKGQKGG